MAKKKDKKSGLVPKRIGGVKIPKQARKQAERLVAELKQPFVREMIVGTVGVAAVAVAKQMNAAHTSPQGATEPKPTTKRVSGVESPGEKGIGVQITDLAADLAIVGLARLFEKVQTSKEPKKTAPRS